MRATFDTNSMELNMGGIVLTSTRFGDLRRSFDRGHSAGVVTGVVTFMAVDLLIAGQLPPWGFAMTMVCVFAWAEFARRKWAAVA